MTFLFDTRKMILSGLACELVIPPEQLEAIEDDNLRRQFARTPYAVCFRCLGRSFTLVSLHVIWGDSVQERVKELKAIADWLEDWSKDRYAWDKNLIALGDFNIEGEDSPLHQAFTSTGLHVPADLRKVARSIFDDPVRVEKYCDQIAWFEGDGGRQSAGLGICQGRQFRFYRGRAIWTSRRSPGSSPTTCPCGWSFRSESRSFNSRPKPIAYSLNSLC